VESTVHKLKEESASNTEYRQTLEKFQVGNDCLLLLARL